MIIEQLKGAAAAAAAAETTDSFTFQIFRRQRLSFHDMRGQSLVHVRVLAGRQEVQQVLVHQVRLRHTNIEQEKKNVPSSRASNLVVNRGVTHSEHWRLLGKLQPRRWAAHFVQKGEGRHFIWLVYEKKAEDLTHITFYLQAGAPVRRSRSQRRKLYCRQSLLPGKIHPMPGKHTNTFIKGPINKSTFRAAVFIHNPPSIHFLKHKK